MIEEEYEGEEEYSDIDSELLKDFEDELASEDKARRKKFYFMLGGLALGVVLVLVIAGQLNDKSANPPQASNVEKAPSAKGDDLDSQLAELNKKNLIDEDFKAPGALVKDEPMEPSVEGQGEEKAASAAEEAKEPTPSEAEPAPTATVENVPEAVQTEETVSEAEKSFESATAILEEEPAATTAPSEEAGEMEAKEPVAGSEPVKLAAIAPSARTTHKSPKPMVEKKDAPFSVQVIATSDAVEALDFRDKLSRRGFESWISMGKVKRNTYSVECGEFSSIKEAAPLSRQLAAAGFAPRTSYINNRTQVTLVVGLFDSQERSIALAERIKAAKLPVRVIRRDAPVDLYHVRVGKYTTLAEAKRSEESVRMAGFETRGVVR